MFDVITYWYREYRGMIAVVYLLLYRHIGSVVASNSGCLIRSTRSRIEFGVG